MAGDPGHDDELGGVLFTEPENIEEQIKRTKAILKHEGYPVETMSDEDIKAYFS